MTLVLYEDNHLLAAYKRPGLLTQPDGLAKTSLEEETKAWVKEKYEKPGNVFLHAIHRLDKPASGVVVFAKTSKALSRLNESIRNQETKKIYLALVEGAPKEKEGTLECWMIHDDYHARLCRKEERGAKLALLSYRVLEQKEGTTLLQIDLKTGRYHQIRLQLSALLGLPILGDFKYGAKKPFVDEGIALLHKEFTIPHPITKEPLVITAPTLLFQNPAPLAQME